MPDDEPPQTTISGRTFTFTTSAQAAVDARRLVNARANRTHLLVDSLFLFVGGALIVAGQWIGVPIAIVAATLLTASQLQVVQRWMVGRNAGSLMGRRTDVTFDATGKSSGSGGGGRSGRDGSDEGGVIKVDGATIIQADLKTGSGLLHIVDHVLIAGQGAVDPPAQPAPAADASAAAPAKQ